MESIIAEVKPVIRLVAPGPGGSQTNPGLAGDPRVAVGGESRGLLVPHQQVANARAVKGIVKGQHRAPRKAKKHVHLLALQAFEQDFGTGKSLPIIHSQWPAGL